MATSDSACFSCRLIDFKHLHQVAVFPHAKKSANLSPFPSSCELAYRVRKRCVSKAAGSRVPSSVSTLQKTESQDRINSTCSLAIITSKINIIVQRLVLKEKKCFTQVLRRKQPPTTWATSALSDLMAGVISVIALFSLIRAVDFCAFKWTSVGAFLSRPKVNDKNEFQSFCFLQERVCKVAFTNFFAGRFPPW